MSIKKSRPRRRPMREADRRSLAVLVRVSEAEHREIARAAGHEPIATWMRRMALRAARRKS